MVSLRRKTWTGGLSRGDGLLCPEDDSSLDPSLHGAHFRSQRADACSCGEGRESRNVFSKPEGKLNVLWIFSAFLGSWNPAAHSEFALHWCVDVTQAALHCQLPQGQWRHLLMSPLTVTLLCFPVSWCSLQTASPPHPQWCHRKSTVSKVSH